MPLQCGVLGCRNQESNENVGKKEQGTSVHRIFLSSTTIQNGALENLYHQSLANGCGVTKSVDFRSRRIERTCQETWEVLLVSLSLFLEVNSLEIQHET